MTNEHELRLESYKEQYRKNKLNIDWVKRRRIWNHNYYLRKQGILSIKEPVVRKWSGLTGANRRQKHIFKYLCVSINSLYRDHKVSAFDLRKIYKKQKGYCVLTGQKLTRDNMSVDHIISKSAGGLNISSNLRLTTKSVNIMRNTIDDGNFYLLCQQVVNTLASTYRGGSTPHF